MSDIWGWNPPLVGELDRSIFAPPRYRLVRPRRPTAQPITPSEAVLHLRLDVGAENGPEKLLIERLIATATATLEEHATIAVMSQEWRMTLRRLPIINDALEIPLPPFAALLKFTVHGEDQDLSRFEIEHDERLPARIYPVSGTWPMLWSRRPQAVTVEFRCGWPAAADVPETLRHALLLAIGTWYENRESLQQFTLTPLIEIGWRDLIEPHREAGFA